MFTDEGYISKFIGVNTKKNLDKKFGLLQSHLLDKIINHVGLTVSVRIKYIEMPAGKPLVHKYKSSLARKCV